MNGFRIITMILKIFYCYSLLAMFVGESVGYEHACNKSDYFEPSKMSCFKCPTNTSMIASTDGYSCRCDDHSVPSGVASCRRCNPTELVSGDGYTCVPRKCQVSSGRYICRKCPSDYIIVTQNLDGSPTKEVLCMKCARGYNAVNNACVRCNGCICAKNETNIRGACVLKKYLSDRGKYEGKLHHNIILDVIRLEYLCINGDVLACRDLASVCVRQFYSSDATGPCRLWILPNTISPQGLPELIIAPNLNEKSPNEFIVHHGQNSLLLTTAVFTGDGKLELINSTVVNLYRCLLPHTIILGVDFKYDCYIDFKETMNDIYNSTFSVFLNKDGILKPLPIRIRMPGDYYQKKGSWSSSNFRRYFLLDQYVEAINNRSVVVYMRKLVMRVQITRDQDLSNALRVNLDLEAQYATKSTSSLTITTTLRVEHVMPNAGILRGFEIWGGVLGSILSLYAIVQWRGEMRRGGLHFSLLPILAGCISDALYFAMWFSTLHALAAEAGSRGLTLPLSATEEHTIRAVVFSTLCLKAIRLFCLNWKQCTRDIFFLDWAEYNSSEKDYSMEERFNWRSVTLAREWNRIQTTRRAPPSHTVVLTLLLFQLIPWNNFVRQSPGYNWAIAGVSWWGSYVLVLLGRRVLEHVVGSAPEMLPKVCRAVGYSLLVFEEESYAHYVHGRNDADKDLRLLAGPLTMCRVSMAPQLRIVYRQLSSCGTGDMDVTAKQRLLTRLLAAFFERALDGLSWVASERSVLERLLNMELTDREAGTTSILLYDPQERTPSCIAVTWWGQEWNLGTFDAMLFGCVVIATNETLLAGFVTIVTWQILQCLRMWFGQRNQRSKTNIQSSFS